MRFEFWRAQETPPELEAFLEGHISLFVIPIECVTRLYKFF